MPDLALHSTMTPHSCSSPTEAHSETAPDSIDSHKPCDIAIIGFSFQFPRSDSAESFWNILISGKCVASEFPPDRLCSTRYHGTGNDRSGTVSHVLALHFSLQPTAYSAIHCPWFNEFRIDLHSKSLVPREGHRRIRCPVFWNDT